MTEKERINQLKTALRAIEARINGEWDNPALMEVGELSTDAELDILGIVEEALFLADG